MVESTRNPGCLGLNPRSSVCSYTSYLMSVDLALMDTRVGGARLYCKDLSESLTFHWSI